MSGRDQRGIKEVKNSIFRVFRDPIIRLLLKSSNLTPVQFETMLIDVIGRINQEKVLSYEEKRKLRSKTVSRGAFIRTLNQARERVREAIYTILLINYLGILDSSFFEDYQQLFERLREYLRDVEESEKTKIILRRIEREIKTRIDALIQSL
ncbi:hypothetical protein J7L65_07260 [Candidatus Bathyarchaeota archaeon]|nr:hypothetical protein [Candidatus Bathyarchaeota archaeon]